ncbi:MAG: hypothetical protein JHC40_14810 [Burkholderiales bacterium]|jgi:hypothetical protein|nr:hypothetical protein [Burkholderiales bacterium]
MQDKPESGHALLRAAELLRGLNHARPAGLISVQRTLDGQLLALLDTAGKRVYTTRPLDQLVELLASGVGVLSELDPAQQGPSQRGVNLADESLHQLNWLIGARLGRDAGLAPWLDPMQTYRLLRWPDFGEIGSDPEGAELCKVIERHELGIATIVDTVQLAQHRVFGLLNSLSLCGVLATGPAQQPTALPVKTPRRTKRVPQADGWLARLRQRLRWR